MTYEWNITGKTMKLPTVSMLQSLRQPFHTWPLVTTTFHHANHAECYIYSISMWHEHEHTFTNKLKLLLLTLIMKLVSS